MKAKEELKECCEPTAQSLNQGLHFTWAACCQRLNTVGVLLPIHFGQTMDYYYLALRRCAQYILRLSVQSWLLPHLCVTGIVLPWVTSTPNFLSVCILEDPIDTLHQQRKVRPPVMFPHLLSISHHAFPSVVTSILQYQTVASCSRIKQNDAK